MTNVIKTAFNSVKEFAVFFKTQKAANHAILIQGSCLDPDNHPSKFPRILPKDAQ